MKTDEQIIAFGHRLFESDMEKILRFTEDCAAEEAKRWYSYVSDLGEQDQPDVNDEAAQGLHEYHKMVHCARPNGDLYDGEKEAYLEGFKQTWNECKKGK